MCKGCCLHQIPHISAFSFQPHQMNSLQCPLLNRMDFLLTSSAWEDKILRLFSLLDPFVIEVSRSRTLVICICHAGHLIRLQKWMYTMRADNLYLIFFLKSSLLSERMHSLITQGLTVRSTWQGTRFVSLNFEKCLHINHPGFPHYPWRFWLESSNRFWQQTPASYSIPLKTWTLTLTW